jgi:hypothetical protein
MNRKELDMVRTKEINEIFSPRLELAKLLKGQKKSGILSNLIKSPIWCPSWSLGLFLLQADYQYLTK